MVTITQYAPGIKTLPAVKSCSIDGHKTSESQLARIMSGSRELPMPNVTRIASISQAHATLLHCWAKLAQFINDAASIESPSTAQTRSIQTQRRRFQLWLNQWEAAFTSFLSAAVASMATEDITQSRVLKTNHLACTVLASDPEASGHDLFDSEFQAIIELAGAVCRARHPNNSPRSSPSTTARRSEQPYGLDVKDPLKVLLARCRQETARNRAKILLSRFYPEEDQ